MKEIKFLIMLSLVIFFFSCEKDIEEKNKEVKELKEAKKVITNKQTPNIPPTELILISPDNNAVNLETELTLSWNNTSINKNSDNITYDIYLGTKSIPSIKTASNKTATSYTTNTLVNNTIYYWKVVAKNNNGGIIESRVYSFTTKQVTLESVVNTITPITTTTSNGSIIATTETKTYIDPRDKQTYETVKIGTQTWFAENLNYKTTIGSWWYDNKSAKGDIYGRLYTWDAACTACPSGWHLPTDAEWKILEKFLGMSKSDANTRGRRGTDEGKKLKSTSGWYSIGSGSDIYGFNALPGGYRDNNGDFDYLKGGANFWSSTEYNMDGAGCRGFYYDNDKISRSYNTDKSFGFSVRCVKD